MNVRRSLSACLVLAAALSWPAAGLRAQQGAPAENPADQPVKPKRLAGAEAWSTLLGNSATGRTSEGMRTDYYGADGTIKTLIDSELQTGKWRLQNDRVCIEYPQSIDDDEEEEGETCYRVTISGNFVVFLDNDGGGWRLRIVAGNPKDL